MKCDEMPAYSSCHKTWNQQVTKRHVTTPTRKYLFKPNHAAICECSQGRLRNETFALAPTDNKTFQLQHSSHHGCRKTRQSPLKFCIHKRFGYLGFVVPCIFTKVNVYLPSLMIEVPDHVYILGDTYTCHTLIKYKRYA
jgi:hypothetical protein